MFKVKRKIETFEIKDYELFKIIGETINNDPNYSMIIEGKQENNEHITIVRIFREEEVY